MLVYHVDKPIHASGYMTNNELWELIDKRNQNITWFSIASTIVYGGFGAMGLVGSGTAGMVPGLEGGLMSLSETNMEQAAREGKMLSWVEVYADGVEGSLSKQAYTVYSDPPVKFVEY
ncbi:hypothetical protein [Lentibacillus kimchii]